MDGSVPSPSGSLPATGTCIGLHNYRFFCRFLVAVISLAVYDILCSTLVVVFKFQEMGGEVCGYFRALSLSSLLTVTNTSSFVKTSLAVNGAWEETHTQNGK